MTKASQYNTVVLRESIGSFHKGEKGAVVEAYTTPYEAYDIEIVTDEGTTKGLLEGIRPEQIERPSPVRFTSIHIASDGTRASVRFSDGSEIIVQADELYDRVL
ncbi:MAG: DUF4926 domain-containing protein [Candidatus Tectomicrobia bacterium]|nr:DUF4926 domain-containing protein [Candidatus Tectomicrobia bacterium]